MRISDWSSDVCSSDLKRFGNAILSRHPILEHDWKALEPLDDFRSIFHVRLAIDGRGINVYDTHLHLTEGGAAIPSTQVADARRYTAATDHGPTSVLAGALIASMQAPDPHPLRRPFLTPSPALHHVRTRRPYGKSVSLRVG